ncbi:MAG: deoxyribodipyrimidine photo-lyase [Sphingomonadaceae bacterium]
MSDPVILWFRQDLRLSDQAALIAAAGEGPVVPVYVLDDETPGDWRIGGAQRWWLHHTLLALDGVLREKGSRLILRRGRAADEVARLAGEIGTRRIHALRHYEPWWKKAEEALAGGHTLCLHDGNYLASPNTVLSGSGSRYRIFTPWWRALKQQMPPERPHRAPSDIPAPSKWPKSDTLTDWGLLPKRPDWASAFGTVWTPGEEGARAALQHFLPHLEAYDEARNLPSEEGSSRLSPHLHFGEISPATIWHRCAGKAHAKAEPFLREIGWRDFSANVIDMFPDYANRNGRDAFKLRWRSGKAADADFAAWTKGQTGYPIVDAGMRQLWATGWMHNRVRMIAASFLIKHLLIDWRRGECWFWDTLVDADYGNNSQNWQWVAGSGIDSSPFGRIMAPLLQSRKFDAAGYIREWVPELAALDDDVIHDPHGAGCAPKSYAEPLIGHSAGRERALAAQN